MLRQHRTIACLLGLTILLMLTLILSGCGGRTPAPTPTPEAITIAATPAVTIIKNPNITEVPTGGQVAISAEATGVNLQIQWSVKRGELSNTEGTSTIYTAPDTPGLDTVDVIVTSDSGTTTKTVTFTVVETPADTPIPMPTEPPAADTPTPTDMVNAILVDQPPTIDGRLDEAVWSQAQPLTYAVHPWVNDSTTVVVRLLWDNKYLYAGFDVSDTQVEGSSTDNRHDGDSVSVIIKNGGQIREYRYSLWADPADPNDTLVPDTLGPTTSEYTSTVKGATTLNDPSDQDEGYTVEMRIPWETRPVAGSTIAADFLSVDHDYNPGEEYKHRDTVFSKISWDGDQNVDTARKSILLFADTPTPPPPECLFDDIPLRDSIAGPSVDVEASITSIENCADNLPTGSPIPLRGTVNRDLTDEEELWILVYASDTNYYPQSADACADMPTQPDENRQWKETLWLGRKGVPEAFHIVAVVADVGSPASNDFHDYLINACKEIWGSVPFVSAGATELDSIIVHTR